jgi:hypothetical protein
LNSAAIGEEAKPKQFHVFFSKIGEIWKELKNDENKYMSSLGGCRQKPIGALNSAGIGKNAKPEKISKVFPKTLVRSGKS